MVVSHSVERTLGMLLATQELILKKLDEHMSRLQDHIVDDKELAKRIDRIEHRMAWVAGVAITIFTIWSTISNVVLAKIGLR